MNKMDSPARHETSRRYALAGVEIDAPTLAPYHDRNAEKARPKLLGALAEDAAVALISDAGTPLVSDPGFKLVREAQSAGHKVTAAPGASSVLTALVLAGLPCVASSRNSTRKSVAAISRPLRSTMSMPARSAVKSRS